MKWTSLPASLGIVLVGLTMAPAAAFAGTPQESGSVQIDVATDQQVLTIRPPNDRLPWLVGVGVRAPAGVISADIGLGGHLVTRPVFALWSDIRFGPRIGLRDDFTPGMGMRASLLPGWRKGFFRVYIGPELDMGFMSARDLEYRVSPLMTLRFGAAIGPVDAWLSGDAGYSFGGYDAGSIRYDASLVLTYRFGKHPK
jgi:hypothetical protein